MSSRSDIKIQHLMLPLLESLRDGVERNTAYFQAELTKYIELSEKAVWTMPDEEELSEIILTIQQQLTKVGLIERTQEKQYRITSFGKVILSKRLNSLDDEFLRKLPGYQ